MLGYRPQNQYKRCSDYPSTATLKHKGIYWADVLVYSTINTKSKSTKYPWQHVFNLFEIVTLTANFGQITLS